MHSKGLDVPIEVVQLSELRARQADSAFDMYLPTRQDYHMLMLVTSDHGIHWVDMSSVDLTAGQILYIRPGQLHSHDADSDHDAWLLFFKPETVALDQLRHVISSLPESFSPKRKDFHILTQLMELIFHAEHAGEDIMLKTMAPGLLQAIVAGLENIISSTSKKAGTPVYHRATELVVKFENLVSERESNHSISAYAESLHVSPKTLARACQLTRELSPKQLIDKRKETEAKQMLLQTDDTVESIGQKVGFTESTNFVKFFKRMSGQTPETYRSLSRHKNV